MWRDILEGFALVLFFFLLFAVLDPVQLEREWRRRRRTWPPPSPPPAYPRAPGEDL